MGRFIELVDEHEEFTVQPDGTDAVITCRRLGREAYAEIQRRHEKVDWRHGGRQVFVPEDRRVDLDKDVLDYVILRWEGVVDRVQQPVPCTRETKVKLPGRVVTEILEMADVPNVSGRSLEERRPNSSGSSSGA